MTSSASSEGVLPRAEEGFTILVGDALAVLQSMQSQSVQCAVTSPPYYGLRDNGTGRWEGGDPACEHGVRRWDGPKQTQGAMSGHAAAADRLDRTVCPCGARRVDQQMGLEETPVAYIAAMVGVFRELRRVLREDGTFWLNMGDCYAANRSYQVPDSKHLDVGNSRGARVPDGLKAKDLIMMPHRLAIALQEDGWYVRSDIVWAKPNPMPESCRDRPTRSHEYLFLLTKRPTYYYDSFAVREPLAASSLEREKRGWNPSLRNETNKPPGERERWRVKELRYNHAGRNKRSVWTIATKSYSGAHFSTFPPALVEPCIKAGSSEYGACGVCGAPWKRLTAKGEPNLEQQRRCGGDRAGEYHGQAIKDYASAGAQDASATKARILAGMRETLTTGWTPTCKHEAPVAPCVVLDPFAGSGTTLAVALALGRHAIGIELNPAYETLMRARIAKVKP